MNLVEERRRDGPLPRRRSHRPRPRTARTSHFRGRTRGRANRPVVDERLAPRDLARAVGQIALQK
eukprot:29196-Pelagococcus_subviridis.AAC.2